MPTVLIADDEQMVRDVVAAILRRSGRFHVLEARDGAEAQEVLEARPVDLVIVDLLMPRVDGLSLIRWARERGLSAAWVILSGRGSFQDAVRAVQLGAFDFITKPLESPDLLMVTVRNALHQRRLAAEREQLHRDVEQRNDQLRQQVARLEEACRLLSRQQEIIEEDLHRAELIQRALLPCDPPPLEGFAVDAIYRPSRNVGGDLYDVVRLSDRHAAIYVADAAGHGVSAAMLAVLLKHRIGMTDVETRQPLAPRIVLDRVNRHLRHECSAPGLFVTAAYCLLDVRTGDLAVASAGHPPLVLLRADGRREMIPHTGPALGLSSEAIFAQNVTRLDCGDRLLLYTDGLCEVVRAAGRPPAEAVADLLAGMMGDGWEILHELLHAAAERQGDEGQEDDLTAVLISAGQSTSSIDNGEPTRDRPGAALPAAGEVLVGSHDDGAAVIRVSGRGSWLHCAAVHDACISLIESRRTIAVDLSLCQHLDSTFLGTLQEIGQLARRRGAPLRIQGTRPVVRALFEELEMREVLACMVGDVRPPPADMAPLSACISDDKTRRRMLLAHEALAALSPQNRKEFIHLIEHLRAEIQRLDTTGT